MMVKMGDADAYVAGLTYEYPEVIKPALQIHRTRPGSRLVTGVYIMIVEDRVFLFHRCHGQYRTYAGRPSRDCMPRGRVCQTTRTRTARGFPIFL